MAQTKTEYRGAGVAEMSRLIDRKLHGEADEETKLPFWLNAPHDLDKEQRKHWRDAVSSRGAGWFQKSDLPLLRIYAGAMQDTLRLRAKLNTEPDNAAAARDFGAASSVLMRVVRVLSLGVAPRVAEAHRVRTFQAQKASDQAAEQAAEHADDEALRAPEAPSFPASMVDQMNREKWAQ